MTSRLKHKLELENVNLNSAYLNESFVLIGTPLPALSGTKKDKLEYVPEWQQEVRDEQGRRRFHGAFTGGWSAGYFNSVGSKEGWAPASFKSTRSNRANKVQRPEDFMDEEDLAQMNEDRQLENTETFRSDAFTGTREELANKEAPASLESLIAPTRSSIGQKLLQKLGWRPGQGIGPRVTLRKLRIQEGKLGRQRVGIEEDENMGDGEAEKHTFAPRDVKLLVYDAKEERQGLGYEKGVGMGKLPQRAGPVSGARPHDDEDDDPYGEASTSSRRFAFDKGDDEEDVIVMGSPSRPSARADRVPGEDVRAAEDRWHDGRPVLSGFTLDSKGVPPDKWFEMPDIPPDWRPRPARVWGTTRRWDEAPGEQKEEKEIIRGAPGKPLTFEERGAALGEEQRMSKAKSVFEFMSEKDRERIATLAASAKSAAPPPLSLELEPEKELEAQPPAEEVNLPPLSPRTASAALRGFMPFGDDLAKQDRYRSYLNSQTLHTKEPMPDLRGGTFDEINKELDDFAASARIFKPLSFAMSSRFTSGSASLAVSDMKQAKPGLHLYDAEKAKTEADKPRVAEVEIKKTLTPGEQAAQDGMYGSMTRVVKEFYPVKLLCKRFGVADPHPDGEPAKINTGGGSTASGLDSLPLPKNDASWENAFIHQDSTKDDPAGNGIGNALPDMEGEERRPRTIAEVGMAEDANQGRDTLSYTKPSIDIFKAIFASDDEDEDDDDEAEQTVSRPEPAKRSNDDPFPVRDTRSVDVATFRPVFNAPKEDDTSVNGKAERKKSKHQKKKRKGVLSFDVGEDGEGSSIPDEKGRKKGKLSRADLAEDAVEPNSIEKPVNGVEGRTGEQDGQEEWVEKASIRPRLVGRKGAADFM